MACFYMQKKTKENKKDGDNKKYYNSKRNY